MNNSKPNIKKKGYIRTVLLVMILAFTFRSLIGIRNNAMQTVLVEYGDIRSEEKAVGLVVRNEAIIRAPISGRISYIAPENIKVPVNAKLLEIRKDRVDQQLINEYNDTIKKLEALDADAAGQQDDNARVYLANIAEQIEQGNLLAVYREKERLAREVIVSPSNNNRNIGRESLIAEKERLEGLIAEGIAEEYARFSGIPVYMTDGYEDVLHPAGLDKIDPSGIEKSDPIMADIDGQINAGEPVIKLVDNCEWYIVVRLSNGFTDSLKVGSVVSIEVEQQEDTGNVKATVCSIQEKEQSRIVALKLRDYAPGMLDKRFMDITVIRNSYSGLVIPAKAVIDDEQGPKVMVLFEGRMVDKRINIKGSDGERVVVGSTQSGSELKLYDKVIINWEKFGGNGIDNSIES